MAVPVKPSHLFDRDAEWRGLTSFVVDAYPGATLGVVSGRRRQGKSYLLQALAAATGGIYFPALELTEAVSLRLFADELVRFTGAPVAPFRDWLDAIPFVLRAASGRPIPVVIDEFPFLAKASPELPSRYDSRLLLGSGIPPGPGIRGLGRCPPHWPRPGLRGLTGGASLTVAQDLDQTHPVEGA